MTARVGFDGYCRQDAWCPLYVVLSNEGPSIEADLVLSPAYWGHLTETYYRSVSLPSHSRKALYLYFPAVGMKWRLQLVADGRVLAEEEVTLQRVDERDGLYAVLGEGVGALGFLAEIASQTHRSFVARIDPAALPPDPLAWESLDVLVLNDLDTADLSLAQRRALMTWVAHGGYLVVGGGEGAARTAAGIEDLLPVVLRGTRAVDDLHAVADLTGGELNPGPFLVAEATPTDGVVLLEQDGLPLIVQRPYGAGTVTFLAFDAAADLFHRWEDNVLLWSSLLGSASFPATQIGIRTDYAAWEAIRLVPGITVPSAFLLVGFALLYTLLVGPINYLLLRRVGRTEWAWVTIPVLAVLFTLVAYVTGLQIRGPVGIVHRLAVVHVPHGANTGRVTALVGFFSPRRATYDLEFDQAQVRVGEWDIPAPVGGSEALPSIAQEEDGVRLERVRFDVGEVRPLIAEGYVEVPSVEADLRLTPVDERTFRLEGTVHNGPLRLTDGVVLAGTEAQRIGDLEPGASISVALTFRGVARASILGPSLPSVGGWAAQPEQILGSGNFWEDRELYRRYQFLSALFPYDGSGLHLGVYLLGWVEEAPFPARPIGRPYEDEPLALYLFDLPVSTVAEGATLTVPSSLITCRREESWDTPFYLPAGTTATFTCTPWTEIGLRTVDEATLLLSGVGTISVEVWDWQEASWQTLDGWGSHTLLDTDRYLSPSQSLRFRVRVGEADVHLERLEVSLKGRR